MSCREVGVAVCAVVEAGGIVYALEGGEGAWGHHFAMGCQLVGVQGKYLC